jgi:hypothetical protein
VFAVVTLSSWIWIAQTVNYCDQIRSVFNDFFCHFFTSVTSTFCLYLASFLSERVFTATAVHLLLVFHLYVDQVLALEGLLTVSLVRGKIRAVLATSLAGGTETMRCHHMTAQHEFAFCVPWKFIVYISTSAVTRFSHFVNGLEAVSSM